MTDRIGTPEAFVKKLIDKSKQNARRGIDFFVGNTSVASDPTIDTLSVYSQADDALAGNELIMQRVAGFKLASGDPVLVLRVDGQLYALGGLGKEIGELAHGIWVKNGVANSAANATNASTSVFVDHFVDSYVLPVGTWSVYMMATLIYGNSVAGSGANARIKGFIAGNTQFASEPVATSKFPVLLADSIGSQSGTISVGVEYEARTGGTASAFGYNYTLIGYRTGL